MILKDIETDIREILTPIRINGFGRVKSIEGVRRKLKALLTSFIGDFLDELCENEFQLLVEVRLHDFNKKGHDKVGGAALIDKNDHIHFFQLDVDKDWVKRALAGNKNIRTRLVNALERTIFHEFLHFYQFERSNIPVDYDKLEKYFIIKKGATAKIRYYGEKSEISAFALNTAQELYYSIKDVNQIKQMLCRSSDYTSLTKRSSAFWRYNHHIRSNINDYPKMDLIWKRYIKRVVLFLDELYG